MKARDFLDEQRNSIESYAAKQFDIIEIIPSHYVPDHPIGNKYVVVGSLDGFDAEIINENGEYATVCIEDYKIIGNVKDLREQFWNKVKERQGETKPFTYEETLAFFKGMGIDLKKDYLK